MGAEFIPCKHGIIWRVVDLWHPRNWRRRRNEPGVQFKCNCKET